MSEPKPSQVGGSKTLSLIEAVRKRPGMYFGGPGPEIIEHLIGELVSNAIDGFLTGTTTRVSVRVQDSGIEVEDDGLGLPFELPDDGPADSLATGFLTRMHRTASATGHAPHVHVHAVHGVGLAVVNAVCASLRCRSWRHGQQWEQVFVDAVPTAPPICIGSGHGRGTLMSLQPDARILGTGAPRPAMVRAALFHAAHLFPGLRLGFQDECFHAPQGLADLACIEQQATAGELHDWGERPVFHVSTRSGDVQLQAAACGADHDGRTSWRTWVNGLPSVSHGVHQQGFQDALSRIGWAPKVALLHVVLFDKRFASPVRDKLVTPGVRETVAEALSAGLDSWCRQYRVGHYTN